MSDEQITAPVTESAPVETAAPSAEQAQPTGDQTPVTQEQGPAQEQQAAAPQEKPKGKKEWDGDPSSVKELGDDPVERAKSMRRYLTRETQKLAEQRRANEADLRLAQEYKQLQQNPQYRQMQTQQVAPQPAQSLWTQAEWEEAQVNPQKFEELTGRMAESKVQSVLQQYVPAFQQMQAKQAFIERQQEIKDVADMYPDFWDLYNTGILKPLVREVVDSGQGSIHDAYQKGKEIEEFFLQKATQESQKRVLQKQAAVTATPTQSGEPNVIYAESNQSADWLAFENALQGKKVQVRTRK